MTEMTDMTSLQLGPGKLRLLLAAERLIGKVGFEQASMRQIAHDADYRNVRAVQYHFSTKEAVVATILRMRRAEMDAKRIAIFADSGRSLEDTPSIELMRYLILPPFDQKNEEGIRSFARFYRAVIPFIYRFDDRINLESTARFTSRIFEVLRSRAPLIADNIWTLRSRATSVLTFNFIANFDEGTVGADLDEEVFLNQLSVMSLALLEAPR